MDKYISTDALIEELKRRDFLPVIVKQAIDAVPAAETCGGWISVVDRLPESVRQANEIVRLKRDRDAAIADLYKAKSCNTCAKQYKDDFLLEECMEPCSAFAEGEVPYKWRREN